MHLKVIDREFNRGKWGIRLRNSDYHELAFMKFGLTGVGVDVHFPSEWHEYAEAWFAFKFFFIYAGFCFPWKWIAPDYHQCSGPQYGFDLSRDYFTLRWGQDTGRSDDPRKSLMLETFYRWKHHQTIKHDTEPARSFKYITSEGKLQERMIEVTRFDIVQKRLWWPNRQTVQMIDLSFSDPTGEQVDSWKGGVLKMARPLLKNESIDEAVQRIASSRF